MDDDLLPRADFTSMMFGRAKDAEHEQANKAEKDKLLHGTPLLEEMIAIIRDTHDELADFTTLDYSQDDHLIARTVHARTQAIALTTPLLTRLEELLSKHA